MQVLLVSEDVKLRLRATSALALRDGVEVIEADGAGDGRTRAKGDEFDVLVIDGDLYPKGGFSLLYELRADAEYAAIGSTPAIVLISREQDRWLAGWAGANEVMIKPVDPFELARMITALHGESPAPRAPADESGEELREVAGVQP